MDWRNKINDSNAESFFLYPLFLIFRKSGNNDSKNRKEDHMIQVKLFDREHEKDLEKEMNTFLKGIDEKKLMDIKYNVAAITEDEEEEQIYCFSAMIIYRA
jgi:Sporulation protein Cse60